MADLENAVASLCLFPDRIPLAREVSWRKRGVHAMVVRKYLLYFRVDEANRQVYVIRVLYGKRDQMAQMDAVAED